MKTLHRMHFSDARKMKAIADESVDLVVTSPPYPMIQMWDELYIRFNPAIGESIAANDAWQAFELMHAELLSVWQEVFRILKFGGIACINVGDAVRTFGSEFRLFPNHVRTMADFLGIGFACLPTILWRKPTNAPTKFMGSGMLPPAAYVTLEHESILVMRKGGNRKFAQPQQRQLRRESAYFWEERNIWFSDIWQDVKGVGQHLTGSRSRKRSAAYPLEIPYRLINMFSVKGDTVVDPFLGTGTTLVAAAAAGRNSVGFELESEFKSDVKAHLESVVEFANRKIRERLTSHLAFVEEKRAQGYQFKHTNRHYGFAVMTAQETDLLLSEVVNGQMTAAHEFTFVYSGSAHCPPFPQDESRPQSS